MNFEHRFTEINGVRLHVVEAGPAKGPLVVFLHGFPEYWGAWRKQLEAFADAGFHAVAPDQRGYNLSDKPKDVHDYAVHELARDVSELITILGYKDAILVGHDWGGIVAWWTATLYPEKVSKLAVLNMCHPSVLKKTIKTDRRQSLRSWYMFAFQPPRIPEFTLRALNFRVLTEIMVRSSRVGTFDAAALKGYRDAWSQPAALTGMLNWYRALFQAKPKNFPKKPLTMPTRLIWGTQDHFLLAEMAHKSLKYCEKAELILIPDATHWVQHEQSGRISELLLEFARQT